MSKRRVVAMAALVVGLAALLIVPGQVIGAQTSTATKPAAPMKSSIAGDKSARVAGGMTALEMMVNRTTTEKRKAAAVEDREVAIERARLTRREAPRPARVAAGAEPGRRA